MELMICVWVFANLIATAYINIDQIASRSWYGIPLWARILIMTLFAIPLYLGVKFFVKKV